MWIIMTKIGSVRVVKTENFVLKSWTLTFLYSFFYLFFFLGILYLNIQLDDPGWTTLDLAGWARFQRAQGRANSDQNNHLSIQSRRHVRGGE